VPSEAARTVLVDSKIDASKIRLWTRGVSTIRFTPARRSPGVRRRWGIGPNEVVLLYVGRISREKGLADIAPLRRALLARGIAHRFVFVGEGPIAGELRSSHPDAIFTGSVTPDDVAVTMASSDVFIFPSHTDTAGNVVLEAQASGLPVLVTNEGGPKENIL